MSKVAALVTASILTLSSGVVLADTANVTPVAPSAQDTNMLDKPQERNTMFDGVNLTEQQRASKCVT
ncbi:Spy/CpxP family protein refolding chaperone [Ewingella americana]